MVYKNLREYIERLEREGQLVRVRAEVDTELEVAEITDRISKSDGGGEAILFENNKSGFPILMNMFGSDRRIAMALGVDRLDQLTQRIDLLLHDLMSPKSNFMDKLRMIPRLGELSKWFPRTLSSKGECQQVTYIGDEAKLSMLPILKCWPYDGGKFITFPLVHTVDPDTGGRNVGMYRMQVTGEYTTGMHWHRHKTGERHYRAYASRGEMMPVTVCIGGDPTYTYAATAPMPDNLDEYLLAGFLRNSPVKLVKSLTNDIYIPSDCDFVIEGFVNPMQDKFVEGPFGDHTGFYSLTDLYPEFHVTAITHRKDAVYPATIVGVPPQEDAYIAKATEKIFLAPIRAVMQPEVRDLYMPDAGTAHNLAIVDIEHSYGGQAYKVANGMMSAGQMMFLKVLMVTSTQESIRDPKVLSSLLRRVDPKRNITISQGVYDVLDHTTATQGEGGKMVIDATNLSEQREMVLPESWVKTGGLEECNSEYAENWSTLVFYAEPGQVVNPMEFMEVNGVKGVNFVVVVDRRTKSLNGEELLWIVSANIDPKRDVSIEKGRVVVDGRTKIGDNEEYPSRFPNVVTSDVSTIELVDRRWSEYGLGDMVESPSRHYRELLLSEGAEICLE